MYVSSRSLREICLELVGKYFRLFDRHIVTYCPKDILRDLIIYLNIKDLDLIEDYFKQEQLHLQCNHVWKLHYQLIWQQPYFNEQIYSAHDECLPYKNRYFEQLFISSRGMDIELCVQLEADRWERLLNLSLYTLEKFNIEKDRIEFKPSLYRNFVHREKWNHKWNDYIKKLSFVQSTWNIICDDEVLTNSFVSNINTLILAGYPQSIDTQAFQYIIRLLTEGNVSHLIIKFPHKFVLKVIMQLMCSVSEREVKFTSDELKKYNSQASTSLKHEILKRSYAATSYLRHFRRSPHRLDSLQMSNFVRFRRSMYDSQSNTALASLNSNNFNDNLRQSSSENDNIENRLPSIDESIETQSNDSRILFTAPIDNNIRHLKSLEIYYVHKLPNIELLSQSILGMKYLENLSISYINPYCPMLEHNLIKMVKENRLKTLSLTNLRLSYGSVGFLWQILAHSNVDMITHRHTEPLRLETLRLEMLKTQKHDFDYPLGFEFPRVSLLKVFKWKDLHFTRLHLQILERTLMQSKELKCLELKSLQISDNITSSLHQVLTSCPTLNELKLINFSFHSNCDVVLQLLRSLKKIHIENGDLSFDHLANQNLYEILLTNTKCKSLCLPHNNLSNETIDFISRAICGGFTPDTIDLSSNNLTFYSLRCLCEVILGQLKLRRGCFMSIKLNANNCDPSLFDSMKKVFNSYKINAEF